MKINQQIVCTVVLLSIFNFQMRAEKYLANTAAETFEINFETYKLGHQKIFRWNTLPIHGI